jgi:hypothetical protein
MHSADQSGHFQNDRVHEYKGFYIKATDPYGLWHIEAAKGPTAEFLKGEFTGRTEAQRRIDAYVNKKIEEENKPPLDKNTRKVQEILKERSEE